MTSINALDQLLVPPDLGKQIDLQWGYITDLAPLRLRNEHEAQPIPVTPSRTVDVGLGDRVLYVHQGSKIIIIGVAQRSGWTTWAPVLGSTGTAPTMGNSTRTGRYIHKADRTVMFAAEIILGSTFDPGTGFWTLPLPVPANVSDGMEWHVELHAAAAVAVLAGIGEGPGYGKIETSTQVDRLFVRRNDAAATNMQRLEAGAGFAAGTRFVVQGWYESA